MLPNNNKTDYNQLIGFILIGFIFVGYMYWTGLNQPEPKKITQKETPITEKNNKKISDSVSVNSANPFVQNDSLNKTKNRFIALENDKISIKISSLGGQINEVLMKGFEGYSIAKESGHVPLYLMKDNNSKFNLSFKDKNGIITNTENINFTPIVKGNTVQMKATTPLGGEIVYNYTLGQDHKIDFTIQTKNLSSFSSDTKEIPLSWKMKAFRQEKGEKWEKQYSELYFSLDKYSDVDYESSDVKEEEKSMDWIAFKQQFFSSILLHNNGFKNTAAQTSNVENPKSQFSKNFSFETQLSVKNNEINESMSWYFLPLEYEGLKTYGKNFEEIIPFGWTIFGWLNIYFFLPIFNFLSTFGLSYGWVILLLTIVVKLVTSPIMYKQFKQSAMMRVLRPEIDEINEKFKDKDPLKKQQATMELYSKTGVNMLAGCIPALLQIPIFYALFNFFPNILDLRRVGFLWADDLTAYDSVYAWTTEIPMISSFYGNHISLLAILYAIVLLIYTKMSSGNMPAPQEGMPDMRLLTYFMPLIFVVFLNSYASGLSWYYLVSNVINIILILVIKQFFIDEEKIHAQLQANKTKPKKVSKFQQRIKAAMEQAQEQQNKRKK
jgi:YidC/Oxa1 family membrane protein insertase